LIAKKGYQGKCLKNRTMRGYSPLGCDTVSSGAWRRKRFLRNVGICLPECTVSHLGRP
jgi:hypothetical protein